MLKTIYDEKEDIPDTYVSLFTEKDDKWEMTEVSGIKTVGDVKRVQTTLDKERKDHKKINREIKEKLDVFEALGDIEAVTEGIDSLPGLKAAAKDGKFDEEEMNQLVSTRVERELSPVKRKLTAAEKDRDDAQTKVVGFEAADKTRSISGAIRTAAIGAKIQNLAIEDVVMIGSALFQLDEGGAVLTKDNVGVAPAINPKAWLAEVMEKGIRPYWWGETNGGGAGGSKGGGSGKNPWQDGSWNMEEQANLVKTKGFAEAQKVAESVGSKVGATRPTVSAK